MTEGKENPVPFRRIVPAGYHEATLTLKGASPLLMNSGEADRDGETYRAYFNLGRTRSKSLEQEAQLRKLEWTLALYLDDDLGPYLPGINIHEMLRQAATKWKRGEDVRRSLVVVEFRVPLQFEGPRDADGLWDEGFRDSRMVANAGMNRGRVVRCRPRFDEWGLEATLAYDPEDLDHDTLQIVVERSRKYGLGDGRGIGFGEFLAELGDATTHTSEPNGRAANPVDPRALKAHKAKVDRIAVAN